MSFLEKLQNTRGELVYLVRGKHNNQPVWHYILVDKPKLPIFLAMVKTGSLDIAEYGKVLESGFGENPPIEIITALKKQYS